MAAAPAGRAVLGWVGIAGFLVVVCSEFMQRWAEAHGFHCLDCDRPVNTAFWRAYFNVNSPCWAWERSAWE